ncbi:hypothetical protein VMCG_03767 [Cytospora schulzeri]|uniref:K Homology domain-containing protein n=1 Tax=Cytospora schulzeri TaxID=448051 RepID=A0A423WUN1_9PEZI|nr:hypothetical protein VMCG_03767 [Valsa malicola]
MSAEVSAEVSAEMSVEMSAKMSEVSGVLFHPKCSPRACHERQVPTDTLKFSNGDPFDSTRLRQQKSQCVRSTVTAKLLGSVPHTTHYWHSGDMAWWFSAAKQVFHDAQSLLDKNDPDAIPFTYDSVPNMLRHPDRAKMNWLSCFVQLCLRKEGSILHPAQAMVRTPCDDSGLADTLRFDVFLLECWSRMGFSSQKDRTTIQTINTRQVEFDMRWKKLVAAHEKNEQQLRRSEPPAPGNVTGCLSVPEPRAYTHIRGKLDQIKKQTGCVVNVPLDGDEPVQITGNEKEDIEKTKRLILDILRGSLMNIDEVPGFNSTRTQYLTANRALCRPAVAEADNMEDGNPGDGGEMANGDGEAGGEEETRLARAAAQNQLNSAQFHLQVMAYSALVNDDEQGRKVLQAFGELFSWDRRPARVNSGEGGNASASSSS